MAINYDKIKLNANEQHAKNAQRTQHFNDNKCLLNSSKMDKRMGNVEMVYGISNDTVENEEEEVQNMVQYNKST